jgi:rhamnose transport system permease protein
VSSARRALVRWESVLVVLLTVIVLIGSTTSRHFLNANNIGIAMSDYTEKAIVAIPLTMVIIAGEIDLSVASVMTLAAVVAGALLAVGASFWIAAPAAILVGAAAGLLNGALVVKLGLPSLVVTLGSLALFRGIANGLIQDQTYTGFPDWFVTLAFKPIPGSTIPLSTIVLVALFIPAAIWLHAGIGGRRLFALGMSPAVTRLAGVRTDRTRVALFVASSSAAAAAGLLLAGRFAVVRADMAFGFELDILTAILLGGVSIYGGRGTLFGVALAFAIVAGLRNSLSLADVPADVQNLVTGSLLILSILVTNAAPILLTKVRSGRAALAMSP